MRGIAVIMITAALTFVTVPVGLIATEFWFEVSCAKFNKLCPVRTVIDWRSIL